MGEIMIGAHNNGRDDLKRVIQQYTYPESMKDSNPMFALMAETYGAEFYDDKVKSGR